jgi:hypothetical protein
MKDILDSIVIDGFTFEENIVEMCLMKSKSSYKSPTKAVDVSDFRMNLSSILEHVMTMIYKPSDCTSVVAF